MFVQGMVSTKDTVSLKRSASQAGFSSTTRPDPGVPAADLETGGLPDQQVPTHVSHNNLCYGGKQGGCISRRHIVGEQELSPLAYLQSGKWARPLACVAILYVVLLSLVVVMVKQLPTRGALADKAHLPADTELLIKLVRPCFCFDHVASFSLHGVFH